MSKTLDPKKIKEGDLFSFKNSEYIHMALEVSSWETSRKNYRYSIVYLCPSKEVVHCFCNNEDDFREIVMISGEDYEQEEH